MLGEIPAIFGIVNITEDSFSDGGAFLAESAALDHARALLADGAAAIDLGAVASNPDSVAVSIDQEIGRLEPVVAALRRQGALVSIDTFRTETQRWALSNHVDYINDIHGFADVSFHEELSTSACKLVVMHSVHGTSHVTRESVARENVIAKIDSFFETKLTEFHRAGVALDRIILDPGMGFFLGPDPEASFAALRHTDTLKSRFGCPVLISVSRKSFLRRTTGRQDPKRAGAATLAAEIFAAIHGADFIRTHDVAALSDALKILKAAVG